ncbi:MAG: hypothetical protein AB7F79_07770 [Steroidobacteraceae bacterium]
MTVSMRTKWNLSLRKMGLFLLALTCLLAACSSGSNSDDKIRIGSGQSGSSGTTDSGDFPIFYVKRGTPIIADAVDDVRRARVFNTNADLYMRDRASPSAAERNITARIHPANERWDVKDVDVSADATKVIFAMRGPLTDNQEDKDPPTWNIWEYTISSDTLRRVISSNVTAEEGQDVSPHYLPDGQVVFSSTRQSASKAVLIQDEGKTGFEAQDEDRNESAFVLHVMNADGTSIQQFSFNQSHDLDPTVLSDGRVLFSRWDHARGTNKNGVHFYTTNPDGTNTQLLYGAASHTTVADIDANGVTTYPAVQFTKPREMLDGRILTLVRPFNNTEYGGDLYIIDTNTYVENNQATLANAGMSGPAQTKSTQNSIRLINAPSPGGRFVSAAPLWDGTGRILVSWSQCRVLDPVSNAAVNCTTARLADPTFVAAPPIYAVWMFNPNDGTQQPIVVPVEGVMVSDLAIAQPRTAPTFRPYNLNGNLSIDQTLKGEGVGILDIRSVYDFDGKVGGGITSIAAVADPTNAAYTNRTARFLRIEKAVSLPDTDFLMDNFNINLNLNSAAFVGFMREIIGYIPIEPDGSVQVKVPGNVAFQISVVNSDGRALSPTTFPRHNAWLTLRPGETVHCNGCHANNTTVTAGQSGRSHGRSGLFASVYAGSTGPKFNNANDAFIASGGQTMAQARAVWSCSNEEHCAAITPNVNLVFANVWPDTMPKTDAKVIPTTPPRTGDTALRYVNIDTNNDGILDGLQTKVPTSSSTCLTTWSNVCRITINYPEHIQPLWALSRPVDTDGNGTPDADRMCTGCHNNSNAATPNELDARQLDLRGEPSVADADQFVSYRELLLQDLELTTDANGVLIPRQVQTGINQNGDPIFATVPINGTRLAALNALGSRFFSKFATGGSHAGYLTSGELRLISEWVDIGAQYYNDPFKAPEN